MNRIRLMLMAGLFLFMAAEARAQAANKEPHVGYLYPAGGQQGTVFTVMVGGQNLRGVSSVHITGEGVSARVVRYLGKIRRLKKEERLEIRRLLNARENVLLGNAPGEESAPRFLRKLAPPDDSRPGSDDSRPGPDDSRPGSDDSRSGKGKDKSSEESEKPKLPDHPLLREIDNLSLEEVEYVRNEFLKQDKDKQPNLQIADRVLMEVTIDEDAAPGDRELRFKAAAGLTNPICFQVGALPELKEDEPYEVGAAVTLYAELPVLFNGQIKPGDVDRFGFHGREGQKLVIEAKARQLIPYLADAVPGWFQATLTLFDDQGKEMAFADDYHFHPDPVLLFKVPETGRYELEIRDAIYRGRDDFVYRIAVGEQPFVESIFPLGSREEKNTKAAVQGWNLKGKRIPLDSGEGGDSIRKTTAPGKDQISNSVTYAIDPWPDSKEIEPNNTREEAQPIKLPRIVNGRIDPPTDVDLFRIRGKKGELFVIEVYSRRLNSPLDSLVKVTDDAGQVLAWNDDYDYKDGFLHRDMGLITHHADSYLQVEFPRTGSYYVHLADAQRHGGEAYGYRLRLGPPRPDFALSMTPSSISTRSGLITPIQVHVLRKDGFDGEIEVCLKDAPSGFEIQGGRIPAGCDRIAMTLSAPMTKKEKLFTLSLEGQAQIGKQSVVHSVVPSENMMQAFLYRHLVPSMELVVSVAKSRARKKATPELMNPTPIRIAAGSEASVSFRIRANIKLQDIQLILRDPPKGLFIHDVIVLPRSLDFVLEVDEGAAPTGYTDNLIVEIFKELAPKGEGSKKKPKQVSLGVLPAIPFEIVGP